MAGAGAADFATACMVGGALCPDPSGGKLPPTGRSTARLAVLAASPVTSAISWPMSTVSSTLICHALNLPAKEASIG